MELIVGKVTDKEMAEVQQLINHEAQIRQQLMNVGTAMRQVGEMWKEWFNDLEKRHKLDHGPSYMVRPSGEIVKVMPEQVNITKENGEVK